MTKPSKTMRGAADVRFIVVASLLVIPLMTGCSGNSGGSSGAGGAGNAFSSLGSSIGLGSLVGGQTGQYVDAGLKGFSAASMTAEDEDNLGQSVAIAATNRWPLLDNPALTKYVTMVGLTLADVTPNPSGNWVFGVLDTPDIGAYSGPNGYVMVTRGALAVMRDESELAGVLAHEMSHVMNHDGFNAVKGAKLKEAGMQAASATEQRIAMFSQVSDLLVDKVLTSGWDRGQETAADSRAVQILQSAGYDAHGLARFLQRMEAARGGTGAAKPFGTHPGTADRVAKINSQAGSKSGQTYAARFAKAKADAKL